MHDAPFGRVINMPSFSILMPRKLGKIPVNSIRKMASPSRGRLKAGAGDLML